MKFSAEHQYQSSSGMGMQNTSDATITAAEKSVLNDFEANQPVFLSSFTSPFPDDFEVI